MVQSAAIPSMLRFSAPVYYLYIYAFFFIAFSSSPLPALLNWWAIVFDLDASFWSTPQHVLPRVIPAYSYSLSICPKSSSLGGRPRIAESWVARISPPLFTCALWYSELAIRDPLVFRTISYIFCISFYYVSLNYSMLSAIYCTWLTNTSRFSLSFSFSFICWSACFSFDSQIFFSFSCSYSFSKTLANSFLSWLFWVYISFFKS